MKNTLVAETAMNTTVPAPAFCNFFDSDKDVKRTRIKLPLFIFAFALVIMACSPVLAQLPTVSSVSPLMGIPGVTVATITGTNFNTTPANNIVYFGATRATVTSASDTSLTATVPAGATYMPVSVNNTTSSLAAHSLFPFLPVYDNSPYVAGMVNFSPKFDLTAATGPCFSAIGDIDGDGKPDLLIGNVTGSSISIYRNISAAGTLTAGSFGTRFDLATAGGVYGAAIGDIDGDGKPDIAASNNGANTVSVFHNIGAPGALDTSSFAARVDFAVGSVPRGVAIGDLNGDGKAELVVANNSSASVSVFRNIGVPGDIATGTFAAKVDISAGSGPNAVVIRDMDGDGRPDLAVVHFTAIPVVSVLRNRGNSISNITSASFAAGVSFAAGTTASNLAVGDIDGDGKPDIVSANYGANTLSVFRNTSTVDTINTGSFAAKVDLTTLPGPNAVAMGDLDGDGKPDLVTIGFSSTSVSVFRNASTPGTINAASFSARVDIPIGAVSGFIAVGDLDSDGKPDLVTANYYANTVSVLKNNPIFPITGTAVMCIGSTSTLSDATAGGTWSSSNPAVATVGSLTGVVTGIAAGTTAISYILGAGRYATTIVTVNGPTAYSVTGGGAYCIGGAGVAVGLSNSQSGIDYQLYLGSSAAGSPVAGTGAAIAFGLQSAAGSYTVSATQTATSCTRNMTGSVTVSVNPIPIAAPTNSGPICNGGTVTLTANPSGGANAYTWAGANLSSTTVANPTATPTATATYSLTVRSGAASGCSPATVYTTVVTVNPKPIAAPTNSGTICNGGTVTLTANPSGGANAYTWTGANLSSTTVANPTATPTATATYSLTVRSGAASGCSPATVYTTVVTVNPKPIAAPTNSGTICNGGTVTLTANPSGGANAYTWAGANLSSTTVANPTATPTATTTYSLTVRSGAASGCSPATVYTTIVTANPKPIGAPTNSGAICNGGTVTLTANPSGGATAYSWSGANLSSSTTTNPTATPTVTTTYSLTVSSGGASGCSPATVYTTSVTVNPTPTASPSNSGAICNGGTVTLTANAAGGANVYTWSGANLSSSTTANPTAIPTVTTTYSLTVGSGGASGCSPATVYTTSVTVNPTPTASPSNSGAICNGGTVTLTANAAGGANVYTWSGANISSSTTTNPTATPTVTTTYSLTVSSGGASGCSPATVYTTSVTVNPTPTASPSNSGAICNGGTVTLTANAAGGANVYTWSGANISSSTTTNPTATPTVTTTYSLTVSSGGASGCSPATVYTTSVTVNPTPTASPSNSGAICNGGTVTLTANAAGGANVYTWSGANLSSSTTANPTATPTVTTTYSLTVSSGGASGCSPAAVYTTTVTVNELPSVSGSSDVTICSGTSTGLTAAGGTTYTWSPGTGLSATTGAGVIASPAASTTYTITGTDINSCVNVAMVMVSVNTTPIVDAGSDVTICSGTSTGLTASGATTYTWSPATALSATTGTNVTSNPTSTITYTVAGTTNDCSSAATVVVSVNATPTVDAGSDVTICSGTSTELSASGGTTYTWAPSLGLSGTTGANVTASPTSTTIYTVIGTTNGCSSIATVMVSVNTTPTMSAGSDVTICSGNSTFLTASGATTYIWSPATDLSATTGATVTAGPAATTIYTVTGITNGCSSAASVMVSVNATPVVDGGSNTVICTDFSAELAATGGTTYTWSPATGLSATTGAHVTAGPSATTVYTVTGTTNGCSNTASVTVSVYATPSLSTGDTFVCVGGAIPLVNTTGGGIWSSSNPAFAAVGSFTGEVTGIGAGVVGISYVLGTGCYTIRVVTVNPTMASITGTTNVCLGTTTQLSHAMSGGVWSCSTPFCAMIDASTGLMTGVHTGTSTITYTVGSGCVKTTAIHVLNITMNVTGGLVVCQGVTSALACSATGGSWTIDSPSVATINLSTGVMTGVGPGTANITYSLAWCKVNRVVTVNILPDTISASTSVVCAGGTISMSNATGGGVWSSSNTARATVGISSGVVSAVSGGTVTISYTIGTGCYRTKTVTIGVMPAAIVGIPTMCEGNSTTLSTTTAGGTWSSGTVTAVIASSSGSTAIVTGMTAGTADISYNHNGGCVRTAIVTVNTAAEPSTGLASICIGGTTTLSNATGGGTWSSSATAKATVGSMSGLVTGIAAGTASITYRTSATCFTTTHVTVGIASAIGGGASVCIGYTTALTHAVSGGTWSSSNIARAEVDTSTGVVTGVSVGSATITYQATPGCFATRSIYVNSLPSAISGTPTVCEGSVRTLTNGMGTWSSSDTSTASILLASGQVTGVSEGTATITFRAASTGCFAMREVTVNATPPVIGGSTPVCAGSVTTYTNALSGGVWSSSSATVMSIDSFTGNATAIAGGGTMIRYTMPTGCIASKAVTVNPLPAAITGVLAACIGNTVVLSSGTSGGTWSNSDSVIAAITGITTGVCTVSGVSTGTATIAYTNGFGCSRMATVTVDAMLPASAGPSVVCVGNAMTLSNTAAGGTWASSTPAKATVVSGTGLVTGLAIGTTNITYSIGSGCLSIMQVTVNTAVATLSGTFAVCVGQTTRFSTTDAAGTWSSANESIATVDSAGMVAGVTPGTTLITYMLGGGCYKTKAITVKALPDISGPSMLGVGATSMFSGSPTGGIWAGSPADITTVGSLTGSVTGIAMGVATITYTAVGCYATRDISVSVASSRPGITATETSTMFSVYPNPTLGSLAINASVGGVFAVCTVEGKQVQQYSVSAGVTNIRLPHSLAAGVYMCRFNGEDGSIETVRLLYVQ